MKWIHEGCLDRWRNESANPRSEVCHYRYQWRRELYSRWLLHWTTTGTISLILIVGSVVVVAFTLKYTALLLLGIKLSRSAFALTTRLVWWAVLVIGCLTMVCLMFSGDNRGDVGGVIRGIAQIRPGELDGDVLTFFGHVFSLGGFALFVKTTYREVEQRVRQKLTQVRDQIIDVRDP
jgi:E3 ubiquitin-protein ligase DOA10